MACWWSPQRRPEAQWSQPVSLGIPPHVDEITFECIAEHGWDRHVRVIITQNGDQCKVTTLELLHDVVKVPMDTFGIAKVALDFGSVISLEFSFDYPRGGNPIAPHVLATPEPPIVAIGETVTDRRGPYLEGMEQDKVGRPYPAQNRILMRISVSEDAIGRARLAEGWI